MANLIHQVTKNYNEAMRNVTDPKVDSWFLMTSPGPLLCILGTYLIFVLSVGPKLMEKRQPLELKSLLILYNAFQVAFSIWFTLSTMDIDLLTSPFSQCGTQEHLSSNLRDISHLELLLRVSWWYFFGKIIELLDTVFIVLRKKQNQVTFLHVYHHSITAIFSWGYLKYMPSEQGIVVGVLNSTVHIVMYSYYLIAALGPEYKKYLWWKKYMTWMQLVQFALVMSFMIMDIAVDCKMPKVMSYLFLLNGIIFICLFGNFYWKTYKPKTTTISKKR